MTTRPELSIVIPTLNEEENLRELLPALAEQEGVNAEVIVVDGGSRNGTLAACQLADLPVTCLWRTAGRAFQLNEGAAAATGDYLLFLHADSRFADRSALRRSLDLLRSAASARGGVPVAGHFALRFRHGQTPSPPSYRYLEYKARLNRKGCSHGDQGILLARDLFREAGGFDESSRLLAETRFADRLRERGEWLLLPAEITTSARRFEREGLKERQILNAVIMALGAAGREEIIDSAGLYLPHDSSGRLRLQPVLTKIGQEITTLGKRERVEFWGDIGRYACENAWQIPFRLDVMLGNGSGDSLAAGRYPLLKIHDRYLQPLTDNRVASQLAAWACRLWLQLMTRQ